jgi:GT2 family glycosyltransferase
MREHPEAGAVGPKIVHPGCDCGSYRAAISQPYVKFSIIICSFLRCFRTGTHLVASISIPAHMIVLALSNGCQGAMLVRKSVVKQVGGLNEAWFMYAEDMEWCQRISDAGWKLYPYPGGCY